MAVKETAVSTICWVFFQNEDRNIPRQAVVIMMLDGGSVTTGYYWWIYWLYYLVDTPVIFLQSLRSL